MPNKDHLRILKQGVEAWNRWRAELPDIRPCLDGADLRGVDFSIEDPVSRDHPHTGKFLRSLYRQRHYALTDLGVDLHGAELNGARLNGANLFRANLTGAKVHRAKLTAASLREAVLTDSDLSWATLEEVDLRKSRLNSASLQKANLRYANLTGANLTEADLTGADLSWATLRSIIAYESILVNADLSYANLTKAVLRGARFTGANLTQAQLVFTDLGEADLAGCNVFGISAWGVNLGGTRQSNLVITRKDQPEVTVDSLEVAQLVYLLISNEKVRHVIDTLTAKIVLILGRFTKERKIVLDAIREELRRRDLVPVLFDFDKPASKDVTGTVETLARLARFIIADLTDPSSVPHELATIVPLLRTTPVLPLRLAGARGYSMFDDLQRAYRWVLSTHEYEDIGSLISALPQVMAPANEMANQLRKPL